ncbi:MAG: sporulation transcription factor Spo0A [Clostridiales bacterium]|nr:sporulation transcription factor Spo0A [Clostridiales bacterium]
MKIRVMVCDDNAEFVASAKSHFSGSDKFELVETATDGKIALEKLDSVHPDVLLLDLVMPNLDGFSVLERVNKGNMKIIIVSALSQEAFISKAMGLGADFYMMKPVSFSVLDERIIEAVNNKRPSAKNRSMDEKISNIFITVGIPAHIKGYQYLREAIKMTIDNPEIINSITKRLYPEVADHFNTSPSKVERAIRHAIEVAWNRGKIENINTLFGVRVYNHNEKPTNGEFIALVADKMLLESV